MVDSAAAWLPGTRPHPPIKPVKDAGRSPYWMLGRPEDARSRRRSFGFIRHAGSWNQPSQRPA